MSVARQAVQAGMWLALFNGASQVFSWLSTLIVARLLLPADYGLMEMATLLTGYVHIFHEMGIGSAVVQRDEVNDDELSSLFWICAIWAVLLALLCLLLAYPTVQIFNEPRLLNITKAVSVLFLMGPVMVVPRNLLHRELRFKALGFVMAASVTVSCIVMIVLAWYGAGVWTLLGGHIVREAVRLVLMFLISGWRPKWHCSFTEALPYLRFGLPVVGARSIEYVISKTDIFFGGRKFSTSMLGQYSFALRLAEIPNFKILSIVNSVTYAALAKLKHDKDAFQLFYLQVFKGVAFVVLPLYVGGVYVAPELIPLVLGEQWIPAVVPFQIVCVGQLAICLSFANATVNMAQGRPRLDLIFRMISLPFFIVGFYLGARSGEIGYLALPWATVVPFAHACFTVVTLRYMDLPLRKLGKAFFGPLTAVVVMIMALLAFDEVTDTATFSQSPVISLLARISIAAIAYCVYVTVFQIRTIRALWSRYRQLRQPA